MRTYLVAMFCRFDQPVALHAVKRVVRADDPAGAVFAALEQHFGCAAREGDEVCDSSGVYHPTVRVGSRLAVLYGPGDIGEDSWDTIAREAVAADSVTMSFGQTADGDCLVALDVRGGTLDGLVLAMQPLAQVQS